MLFYAAFSCVLAAAVALYSSSDDVVELTAANFNKLVINSDELWLVEFYAPWCGHCKSLAPEWKKAATALKGVVKVGAVDMDVHSSVGGPYNVRGFPTLKVFGANKNSPSDYNGQRQANPIIQQALTEVTNMVKARQSGGGGQRSSGGSGKAGDPADVVELTDSNFQKEVLDSKDLWMVEFYAPWCGHCQRLEPEWAKAASELKGKVKFGKVDATVHTVLASRLQVQGYPTLKMWPAGSKSSDSAVSFDGGRTASDIIAWATEKLAENIPPPEPVELIDASVLEEACQEHPLCIVAVLPHILDSSAKGRNAYIASLKTQAAKFKKNQWSYVWTEAGQQPGLEEALGIGGFGYPAMVAVNVRKAKFALLRGSFSDTGIYEFFRELSYGRGSTAALPGAKLPEVQKREPWDGKDGQLMEEEEYDLSDIELEPLDEVKVEL